MEKGIVQKSVFTPMSKEEKADFDKMMSEMQQQMETIRLENVRKSREAERASAVAYLNC